MANPAQKLHEVGQSVWYDNIERRLLKNNEMAGMIERGEIYGVTSNPSIFMKAITKSDDYDKDLRSLKGSDMTPEEVFFELAIEDIQSAADLLSPVYEDNHGTDGLVCLEVSPFLADETEATLSQAEDLWERVDRPNLMVKIPATKAGLPAIEDAIFAGINVNVTLIFSLERHKEVMDAYLKGLERRAAAGLPVEPIVSVASFFVSRVDVNVDDRLAKIIESGGSDAEKAKKLMGKAAIANACLAYANFKEVFNSARFLKLKDKGANVQKPLWASTSTKSPEYRDVLYVEELIGPDTVNTMPPQTLTAFLDHGEVKLTLEENLEDARKTLEELASLGISMDEVTDELLTQGVKSFSDSFTVLLEAIDEELKKV